MAFETPAETPELTTDRTLVAPEVAWEIPDLTVEASPAMMEVATEAIEDALEDTTLKIDETAELRGLELETTPVGRTGSESTREALALTLRPEGLTAEDETPWLELEEVVGLTEMMTLLLELLVLPMLGKIKLKEVWLVLTEVVPCLMSLVAEEVWLVPREAELLAGLAELADLIELEVLTELEDLELTDLTELLAGLTELLDFTEVLELLTADLLELFGVGIEMGNKVGSLIGLLDLEETLALLVELDFFDEEDELSFLLLEGATGALLDEEDFLLEEEDFADADEVFLLEATGLIVTVDFLMLMGEEEAVLGRLVNFKILERVSCLVEAGSMMVETFLELELDALALLELFFELELELAALALLEDFFELTADTLVLPEGFAIEETLGMDRVTIGLTEEVLAVGVACPEWKRSMEAEMLADTPAETPRPSRGSLAARSTLSSLLSLEFKGAARMRAGARRPRIAAWPAMVIRLGD